MLSILLRRISHRHQAFSIFSLVALAIASFAWLPIPTAVAAPIADPNAYVTANVNLRAGPDTDYPAVIIIPAQEYVTIFACVEDLTWCDVSYGEDRGWVSAQYIQPFYQDRYMTVQEYAPLVSLPTGPFDIKLYWSSYYSAQPFYGELDQWAAPRPAFRTNSFYEPLGSYGDWVEVQDQYVWVPRDVDRGWRPYTRGHWVDTDQYGWFWASDEPFGWATYHYGRWGFSHDVGWFWVPGTRWAPAWVAWRGSDNYLGWAPLPPAPDDGLNVSISIGSVPDYYWQVVPSQSFLAVDLSVQIVQDENVFRPAFEQTRPLGNVTIVNNVVVNKVVNITYVEQKTQRKVVVEKVAAAGTADPAGKNAVGKIAVFTPPAKGGAKPAKLKKIEEVALVSKTKGQAGNQKALDLATTTKLKGPPPGKKAKAGGPPPPPPAGSAATLNAAKPGGQPCPAGQERRGNACVPIKCPADKQLQGDKCVCLPGTRENANHVCEKPKLAACTGGQEHRGGAGPCECPAGKPDFVNGVCEAKAPAKAALTACTGGQVHRGGAGPCECPAGKPDFVNGVCEAKAAAKAALTACTGGQVHRGGAGPCECPAGKPDLVNGVCEAKAAAKAALTACTGGQVHQGGTGPCVCPPGKPDFVNGVCEAKAAAKAALTACTGGQEHRGGTGPCVCPPVKPDFVNGVCEAKAPPKPAAAQAGQAAGGQGPKPPACVGGKVVNNQCECPPGSAPCRRQVHQVTTPGELPGVQHRA